MDTVGSMLTDVPLNATTFDRDPDFTLFLSFHDEVKPYLFQFSRIYLFIPKRCKNRIINRFIVNTSPVRTTSHVHTFRRYCGDCIVVGTI